jgi:hypothetical protein
LKWKGGDLMMNKRIQFEDLETILSTLGFEKYKIDNAFVFQHKQSDSSIALPYKVQTRHLEMIKKMVIDKGVTDTETFEYILGQSRVEA